MSIYGILKEHIKLARVALAQTEFMGSKSETPFSVRTETV